MDADTFINNTIEDSSRDVMDKSNDLFRAGKQLLALNGACDDVYKLFQASFKLIEGCSDEIAQLSFVKSFFVAHTMILSIATDNEAKGMESNMSDIARLGIESSDVHSTISNQSNVVLWQILRGNFEESIKLLESVSNLQNTTNEIVAHISLVECICYLGLGRIDDAESALNVFGSNMKAQWSTRRLLAPANPENTSISPGDDLQHGVDQSFIRFQFLSNFLFQPQKDPKDDEEELRSKGCFQEKIDRNHSLAICGCVAEAWIACMRNGAEKHLSGVDNEVGGRISSSSASFACVTECLWHIGGKTSITLLASLLGMAEPDTAKWSFLQDRIAFPRLDASCNVERICNLPCLFWHELALILHDMIPHALKYDDSSESSEDSNDASKQSNSSVVSSLLAIQGCLLFLSCSARKQSILDIMIPNDWNKIELFADNLALTLPSIAIDVVRAAPNQQLWLSYSRTMWETSKISLLDEMKMDEEVQFSDKGTIFNISANMQLSERSACSTLESCLIMCLNILNLSMPRHCGLFPEEISMITADICDQYSPLIDIMLSKQPSSKTSNLIPFNNVPHHCMQLLSTCRQFKVAKRILQRPVAQSKRRMGSVQKVWTRSNLDPDDLNATIDEILLAVQSYGGLSCGSCLTSFTPQGEGTAKPVDSHRLIQTAERADVEKEEPKRKTWVKLFKCLAAIRSCNGQPGQRYKMKELANKIIEIGSKNGINQLTSPFITVSNRVLLDCMLDELPMGKISDYMKKDEGGAMSTSFTRQSALLAIVNTIVQARKYCLAAENCGNACMIRDSAKQLINLYQILSQIHRPQFFSSTIQAKDEEEECDWSRMAKQKEDELDFDFLHEHAGLIGMHLFSQL